MGLFNQILNAINDPEKEASTTQISSIVNTIQTLSSNYQTNPSAIESAMSIVGKYTRSALQEKRNHEGPQQVQNLINQFAGTQGSNLIIQTLFSTPQIEEMVKEVETKTGLNQGTVERILPILVPLVLNFLKTGSNSANPAADNSVLGSFLDADGDGDVDMADAIQMATKYLQ